MMELADRFIMPHILLKCELFLATCGYGAAELLYLADRYRMRLLAVFVTNQIQSEDELIGLMEFEGFELMSESMKDVVWKRIMSSAAERLMAAKPYQGGYFQQVGSEEAHTVESFERRISGTDTTEPRREFSTNQYTERRRYGRDENGELVVKIEQDPKEPVRPVTPVEPVMPVGSGYPGEHLLKPIKPFETLPLQIPRIETGSRAHSRTENYYPIQQNSNDFLPDNNYGGRRSSASAASPRSVTIQGPGISPRSVDSGPLASPRSTSSAGSRVSAGGTPMKKKTRLVSIYDGRPLSPYVETVTYEPRYGGPRRAEFAPEPRSVSRYEENWGRPLNGYDRSPRSNSRLSFGSRLSASPQPARPFSAASSRTSAHDECSMLVYNPLYSDF
ncbi:hypothetical protein PENTCL1PPCAC_27080 [Pristionchus entomophagus]|uniref:BTB domain-containing protein n=1 Tax=Pristionchus entomophagus TaxID=358040 RepID=A0AAV5UD65_9BILA|nr:hypothetical protein PENTCL1PPCAC_27080 [Pristionchus entomophagus]